MTRPSEMPTHSKPKTNSFSLRHHCSSSPHFACQKSVPMQSVWYSTLISTSISNAEAATDVNRSIPAAMEVSIRHKSIYPPWQGFKNATLRPWSHATIIRVIGRSSMVKTWQADIRKSQGFLRYRFNGKFLVVPTQSASAAFDQLFRYFSIVMENSETMPYGSPIHQ